MRQRFFSRLVSGGFNSCSGETEFARGDVFAASSDDAFHLLLPLNPTLTRMVYLSTFLAPCIPCPPACCPSFPPIAATKVNLPRTCAGPGEGGCPCRR